jgi:hypothetical protein
MQTEGNIRWDRSGESEVLECANVVKKFSHRSRKVTFTTTSEEVIDKNNNNSKQRPKQKTELGTEAGPQW